MKLRGVRNRKIIALVVIPLPQRMKASALRNLLGWTIGYGVSIGLSYVDADSVNLDDGVHIGHFNSFRNLAHLEMGKGSYVKNFNSFAGSTHWLKQLPSRVTLGSKVSVMSHHFADCAGTLVIEDNVMIGGRSTEIYTHTLTLEQTVGFYQDLATGRTLVPTTVIIGKGAYIGARCTLVSCVVPPGAMVGAGAVVVSDHSHDEPGRRVLLAGNPAVVKKVYSLSEDTTSEL